MIFYEEIQFIIFLGLLNFVTVNYYYRQQKNNFLISIHLEVIQWYMKLMTRNNLFFILI